MLQRVIEIDLDEIEWMNAGNDAGDEAAVLLALVQIGGTLHHLEARAVFEEMNEAGVVVMQLPAEGVSSDDWHDLCQGFGNADDPFMSTMINGRRYAIFMSPTSI